MPLEGYVYQVAVSPESGIMGVQLHDGTVLKYDAGMIILIQYNSRMHSL